MRRRTAGRGMLQKLAAMVVEGVTTLDLERAAESMMPAAGAEPAFKGYRGYPATLCTSVNEEIVHGMPSATPVLKWRYRFDRHGRGVERLLRGFGDDGADRRGERGRDTCCR